MRRADPGFTLLELVIVVAIVGILASVALPLSHWTVKRSEEVELQRALRQLRDAIDSYHQVAVQQLIEVKGGEPGYPLNLQTLVAGVLLVIVEGDEGGRAREPRRIKFLRRIPIDPVTGRAEWGRRCYESDPDARFWCGTDVFDVYSLSRADSIEGTPYSNW